MATNNTSARIRPLKESDRDAWVNIMGAGYGVDAQFQWRCPRHKEFPEDIKRGNSILFDEAISNSSYSPFVAEIPDEDGHWAVVGLATWTWRSTTDFAITGFDSPENRRDMDPKRQQMFIDALAVAEERYFGPEWGPKRLEAVDIVVDPKYHRRGVGKVMTKWALDEATKHQAPVTLTASPLGKLLYSSVGFKDLGKVECEVVGDDGKKYWVYAMIWVPEGWKKPSSQTG
jgi:ribosomal protein S18 acetylase RimI-like enzyme